MTDLLALLVVAGMAILGRKRGTVGMSLLGVGLLGGYAAALLLARPVGSLLSGAAGLPPLVAYPIAGMTVLLMASAAISLFARRWRRERDFKIANGWQPPDWDVMGGVGLGIVYGIGCALILAWAGSALGGLYGREAAAEGLRSSLTGRASSVVTQRAIGVAARGMTSDPFTARTLARFITDPAGATASLNTVAADERVGRLITGPAFRQAAVSGNPDALARDPALRSLARDEGFIGAMREFGVLEPGDDRPDPAAVSAALTRELGPVVRVVETLRNDEEIRRTLADPALRGALERGDYVAVARDPGFERVFERVLEELRRLR